MKKIVTFGEIMLRLAPPGYRRFVQAESFEASYGGAEANVAVSLANFGLDPVFVTKLPEHEIGQAALNALRRYGVDTSMIVRGGDRLGVYYLEKGASQRASKVVYDRKGSSIAEAGKYEFDWDAIFQDAHWFHFTGITPALSDNVAAICLEACRKATDKGIKISCDLNYRKNLWGREKARSVMAPLMEYVNVCVCNEEDAADVFSISAKDTDVSSGKLSREGFTEVAKTLAERFSFDLVGITLRSSRTASDNMWAAMIYDGKESCFSEEYPVHIVDRVGGGDAFSAALIYALINGYDTRRAAGFAAAASCLKHTIEGDFSHISIAEAEALMKGDGSGRVKR
ncbi:MAG: sugar kinase [Clostridiales bacterium]|nr:sugar kinase [Clostridiales bacterium]